MGQSTWDNKNNTLSALLLSHHITLDTHDPSALLYKLESSNSNLHRSSALRIPQPPSTCIARRPSSHKSGSTFFVNDAMCRALHWIALVFMRGGSQTWTGG